MKASSSTFTQQQELKSSLTLHQQWTLLRRFIEDLPLSECKSINTTFIDTLTYSALHILLIKKRAELDLLRSEANHAELQSDCSIQLPNYANASPPASLFKQPSYFVSKEARRDMRIDISGPTLRKLGAEGFPDADLRSPISPESPSFGPRRGKMLSGTVLRRRSIAPHSPQSPQSPIISEEEVHRLTREDWEKRVQFEAAWKEIEAHLEEYVGKFSRDEESGISGKQKNVIWQVLISSREEAEELVERIRTGRKDVGV